MAINEIRCHVWCHVGPFAGGPVLGDAIFECHLSLLILIFIFLLIPLRVAKRGL
jgi:hypothetical protein